MFDARTLSEPTVLSIDAGSQSARAALFTFAGERLGSWQQLCDQTAEQATVEQDPLVVLAAVRQCLDHVTLEGDVQAAAIVSQGASAVCYRRCDGRPLSPVLSWQDRRGESYLGQLSVSADQVHQLTGLPLSCHYGATKLRWCLEHLPEVAEAQRHGDLVAGPLMSLLLHHLCQERPSAVDSGSASRTQLWNLQRQQWDVDLCREFIIPVEVLPRGRGTCSTFGTLRVVGRDVPVVCANRDQQAALFADGWPRSNVAYVNLGTGAFIQSLWTEPRGPHELLINRVLSGEKLTEPLYSLEGTVHGVAGALPWLERHLGFTIVPQLLEDALQYNPPADKTIYFVNGIMGMGSPYWRSQSVGKFSDLLTTREKLLGWLESVVFMLLENLRIIATLTRVDQLSLSGGFSNLTGLVQRLADLSGLPCQRRVDHEATLRGAAFLAAGRPESWQPAESQIFRPAPNPGLQQRYQQWRTAMSNPC
jgi:glycerol kinase